MFETPGGSRVVTLTDVMLPLVSSRSTVVAYFRMACGLKC